MSVVALHRGEEVLASLTSETILPKDATLVMLGSLEQRRTFEDIFEQER